MSRLDDLIAELCPDGVEFKRIKEVYTRLKGTPITAGKMKEIESSDGEIRVFAGGKTVINAREEDIPNANITRVPAVLVQSRGVIDFVFYEEPFTFKNEMWAYTHKERISVKFLYYVLKNNAQHFRDAASGMGSLPQISLPVTEEYKVPVPPLEVQREIVRVLDNFTFLSAELSAELSARRKQYEYYRGQLLNGDYRTVKLSDIAEYITERITSESVDIEHYVGVENLLQNKQGKKEAASVPTGSSLIRFQKDDVLIGNIRPYLKKIWFADTVGGTNGDVLAIRVKQSAQTIVLPKYLYYILASDEFFAYDNSRAKGAKMPRGDKGAVMEYPFTLPPIEEQRHITQILDRFDTLCNDLSSGLPAEIEARQKQYEYYRDKLLTFKEKVS